MVPYEELSEGGNQTSLLHPIPVSIRTNGYHTIHEQNKDKSNEKIGVLDNLKNYIMIFENATVQAFQPIYQPLFKIWIFHKLFIYFALFTPFTFLPNMMIHRNQTSLQPIHREDIGTIIGLIGAGDALGNSF